MDEVPLDCKFVGKVRLVRKDDQVANLGAEIFVVCEGTVDEYKELCKGRCNSLTPPPMLSRQQLGLSQTWHIFC